MIPGLLDEYQAYLKFNGRAPRTLEEVAIARADYEHRRRLAEVKAIRAKLMQLDGFVTRLAERGIQLSRRDITTHDKGKTLRIPPSIFAPDNKLRDVLIELGFKEVERKDSFRDEQQVTLKHGRSLLVVIDVKKPAPDSTPAN